MEADWKEPEDVLPPEGQFVLVTTEPAEGLRFNVIAFMLDGEWYLANGRRLDMPLLAWTERRKPWAGTKRGDRQDQGGQ
jgi:hypothetical protein